MRWPFRYKGDQADREGKAEAKKQLEVAHAIEEASFELAHEHRWLLYHNHFAEDMRKAMEGR